MVRLYKNFWDWFKNNEDDFFITIKSKNNIEKDFFDKLSPKLKEIKDGLLYSIGMIDEDIVELIFTADGNIPNIVFVEELIKAAPTIDGWLFTLLKQESDMDKVNVSMSGYNFNTKNIQFYPNYDDQYPDEINLTIVHSDLNKENNSLIKNGVFIFLDYLLGELKLATIIDHIEVVGEQEAVNELVPIEKLKAYLNWRQKEFIEKYEGIRRHTEEDTHATFEAQLSNGNPLFAVMNTDLLAWDAKVSHPWILRIEIQYDGKDNYGLPSKKALKKLDDIEEVLMNDLKDYAGYLNIGRQTANNSRVIYFACKDFRKGAKSAFAVEKKYAEQFEITFTIYKDKYWRSFNRFQK